ncbi:ketosteroid isomerase-related protein [Roseomonas mucosa]|uniref:ketosteroid isomerase-related protein n=1 Tax=Roseomonas mucosa TaxID=207340 RepID=UPI0028CF1FAA|nr:ketosteroid isomerase-related protein [Roseomonas mucosa]MDT8277553.1 ketosteroid isomerase-related protein [Roseomonas mucosa]
MHHPTHAAAASPAAHAPSGTEGGPGDPGARPEAHASERLILAYYDAFNRGDWAAMLDCLAEDVAHDINQGGRQVGKQAFAAFLKHMERCYREKLVDLVVMLDATGTRAAAEFVVEGEYLATDEGLPPAQGQRYVLPAGAFLTIRDGRIARLSMAYNLADWMRQVGG